jgi:hypothetical protein
MLTRPLLIICIICQMSIANSFGQSLCDSTSKTVFFWTDHPPKMNISIHELETIFNAKIILSDYQITQDQIVYLTLTINCKGEQFNFKVLSSDNHEFNIKLTDCVKDNVLWTPAKHDGQSVDYSYRFTIRLRPSQIHILDN